MHAASCSQIDTIRCLINANAPLEIANVRGQTALDTALAQGYSDVALLLAGVPDKESNNALCRAAHTGSDALFEQLLAAKASLNMRNLAGLTPLMLAVRRGDPVIVSALVEAGASLDDHTAFMGTPRLRWRPSKTTSRCCECYWLPRHCAASKMIADTRSCSWRSTSNAWAPRKCADDEGSTALAVAAQKGDDHLLKLLLTANVSINRAKMDSKTPLMFTGTWVWRKYWSTPEQMSVLRTHAVARRY